MKSPNSHDRNPLSRIRNSLVFALNDRIKLPKFIFVILDEDVVNCERREGENTTKWLITQLGQGSSNAQGPTPFKRQFKWNEPFVVFVKPLPSPVHWNHKYDYILHRRNFTTTLDRLMK